MWGTIRNYTSYVPLYDTPSGQVEGKLQFTKKSSPVGDRNFIELTIWAEVLKNKGYHLAETTYQTPAIEMKFRRFLGEILFNYRSTFR